MIKEGLLQQDSILLIPLSYKPPSGNNLLPSVVSLLGKDIGNRGFSVFSYEKNVIRIICESDTSYNTNGSSNAYSILGVIDGKKINPSYGLLTTTTRVDFYTNKTNHHEYGDKIHIYGDSGNSYYSTHTVNYSSLSYLIFEPELNSNLISNTNIIKIVNGEGYPIMFQNFRGYDVSKFSNDGSVSIIEYYQP